MKNDYILIRDMASVERRTESGIIVPLPKYQRIATVVCSNSDNFNVGDTIIKPIGKGTPITIDGVAYEAINSKYIFATIKNYNN